MHEAILRVECARPEQVRTSLEPDIEDAGETRTEIVAAGGFVEIRVSGEKLNRVRAVLNSYMSLLPMLLEADEKLLK